MKSRKYEKTYKYLSLSKTNGFANLPTSSIADHWWCGGGGRDGGGGSCGGFGTCWLICGLSRGCSRGIAVVNESGFDAIEANSVKATVQLDGDALISAGQHAIRARVRWLQW